MRRIYCTLRELMEGRHMSVNHLHRLSRVDRGTIAALRGNTWKGVRRETLARLAEPLNVRIAELLLDFDEDIWAAFKLHREGTIHLGATPQVLSECWQGDLSSRPPFHKQGIGLWDFMAAELISDYLENLEREVHVKLEPHVTGAAASFDPGLRNLVARIFKDGNHVIIGSPRSNQFAEESLCCAVGVNPYTPANAPHFPYTFVWDSPPRTASSFASEFPGEVAGIKCTRTGKLVARRTFVSVGTGQDGALLAVYRVWVPPSQRRMGLDDERIIIWVLGLSGPGTYAGAKVAIQPKHAAALYPPKHKQTLMRPVTAEYVRTAVDGPFDNRELKKATLLEGPEEETDGVKADTIKAAAGTAKAKPRPGFRPTHPSASRSH